MSDVIYIGRYYHTYRYRYTVLVLAGTAMRKDDKNPPRRNSDRGQGASSSTLTHWKDGERVTSTADTQIPSTMYFKVYICTVLSGLASTSVAVVLDQEYAFTHGDATGSVVANGPTLSGPRIPGCLAFSAAHSESSVSYDAILPSIAARS